MSYNIIKEEINMHEHHCHHGEGHCHEGHCGNSEHQCGSHKHEGCGRGGRRENAGRKCENLRIPFNRRLSEDSINILKEYAAKHEITETEALETAICKLKEE